MANRELLIRLITTAQTTVEPDDAGNVNDEFVRGLCAVIVRATPILDDDDTETIRRLITGVRGD